VPAADALSETTDAVLAAGRVPCASSILLVIQQLLNPKQTAPGAAVSRLHVHASPPCAANARFRCGAGLLAGD
jgi:hypothetical protein